MTTVVCKVTDFGKTARAKNISENGKITKLTATESISQRLAIIKVLIFLIKDFLANLLSMAKAWKISIMEILTKECMKMVTLMAKANTFGKMGLLTKEILLEASEKEKEFGPINKEIDTKASLKRTKRMVQASSHGPMVIYTRGNSEMMSEKVKVK